MSFAEVGLTEDIILQRINDLWGKLNQEYQPQKKLTIPRTTYKLTGDTLNAFFSLCSSEESPIPKMVILLQATQVGELESQTLIDLINKHQKIIGKRGVPRIQRDECRNTVRYILSQLHKSRA